MQITKKRTTHAVVSVLLLVAIFAALLTTLTANAATPRSRSFNATMSNNASVTMEVPDQTLFTGRMNFSISGAPSTAQITRIEVIPGNATASGAFITPTMWIIERNNVEREILPAQLTQPINLFNNLNPNGVYSLRFTGEVFRNGNFLVGMLGFRSMRIIVHYTV